MLRRHYGVTHTSIASFTVRINKIPFAITKCPFDLVLAFKAHLADYHLPDEVIERYVHNLLSRRQVRPSKDAPPAR